MERCLRSEGFITGPQASEDASAPGDHLTRKTGSLLGKRSSLDRGYVGDWLSSRAQAHCHESRTISGTIGSNDNCLITGFSQSSKGRLRCSSVSDIYTDRTYSLCFCLRQCQNLQTDENVA
ncbi:uncharacterized protein LOC122569034 [Bombus pyrosoma]|uniref:uncharacterized protein LOC122569034 n=1 Tax=Bombus pyrosoma TaxID=396416 RepID=UPI001CB89752|nr:uncharacterized protein LOC122569034 [Bombus pyrosoma]